jgi:hypothetical protein
MRIPVRPFVGFGAGAAAVAFVMVAVATSPRAETVLQASAKCPDAAKEFPLQETAAEAQRPA